jgi:hypothetical protein
MKEEHAYLAPFFAPGGKSCLIPDMHASEYRAVPGINPSLVKKVRSSGLYAALADMRREDHLARGLADPYLSLHKRSEGTPAHFEIGTLIHSLVLEPDKIDRDYAVVSDSMLRDIMAAAKGRLAAELVYNANWSEAKAWKSAHGVNPASDAEKAEVIASRVVNLLAGEKASEQPEFIAWSAEQKAINKTVIWQSRLDQIRNVVDRALSYPVNRQVFELLGNQGALIEPSIFGVLDAARTKGRADFVTAPVLGSVKTLGKGKRLEAFDRETALLGYDIAEGAYIGMLRDCGVKIDYVVYLVLETEIPYRSVSWVESLNASEGKRFEWGEDQFRRTVAEMAKAHETGVLDPMLASNVPLPLPDPRPGYRCQFEPELEPDHEID